MLIKRLAYLSLELHPEKTRIVHCDDTTLKKIAGDHENGFVFIGFKFKARLAESHWWVDEAHIPEYGSG